MLYCTALHQLKSIYTGRQQRQEVGPNKQTANTADPGVLLLLFFPSQHKQLSLRDVNNVRVSPFQNAWMEMCMSATKRPERSYSPIKQFVFTLAWLRSFWVSKYSVQHKHAWIQFLFKLSLISLKHSGGDNFQSKTNSYPKTTKGRTIKGATRALVPNVNPLGSSLPCSFLIAR